MTRFIIATALLGLGTAALSQPASPATGTSFDQFAAKAREHLMAMDTDHDGKISKAEFAARAESMGGMRAMRHHDGDQAAAGGAAKHRDPSKMFDRLDTNHDGYLDATEMNAMLARRFARMDANHDGILTPDERHYMHDMAAPEQ